MSDSENSFDPENLPPSNPQLFEKHAQVMSSGSFFAAQLSIQTLLEVDFSDKKLRNAFFSANANSSLISIFHSSKFPLIDPEQQVQLIEKAYQLASKLAADDLAILKLSDKLPYTVESIQNAEIPSSVLFLSKISKNPEIRAQFLPYVHLLSGFLKQSVQSMFTYNVVSRVFKPVKSVPLHQINFLQNLLILILQLADSHSFRVIFRESYLPLLTQLLYSQTRQIRHTATEILRKLIQLNNIQFLIPHLPHFTSLLSPSETPEFLYSASHILVKIALLADGDRVLTESGAITPIISLLGVSERKILIAACQVIIGISQQNGIVNIKICDTLCAGGIITAISDGITRSQGDFEVLTLLLHSLSNVCCSTTSATRQNAELHENVLKSIKSLNSGVIQYGALSIAKMCTNKPTATIFMKKDAIFELFSLLQRLISNIYDFTPNDTVNCVFSTSEALSTLIADVQIASRTGITLSNIFQIVIKCFKFTENQHTRASLLKLVAQLSKSPENAQIFLEHKIVDFIAFLALEAQISRNSLLQQNVCAAISTISFSAPSYRNAQNRFYGDGSVLSEFGRRGIVGVVCSFLCFGEKGQMSIQEFSTVKFAVSAVCSLSKCCRNCLLMQKEGIVEKLLFCVKIGDSEMKNEAASGIRSVRKALQCVSDVSGGMQQGGGGIFGVGVVDRVIGMYE